LRSDRELLLDTTNIDLPVLKANVGKILKDIHCQDSVCDPFYIYNL